VASTGETAAADVACVGEGETLRQAGHRMRELGVATLGVRGEDGELRGVISGDLLVESIAAGGDPKTVTVGDVVPAPGVPARERSRLSSRSPMAVS
jgi:CBS domain-containing protein